MKYSDRFRVQPGSTVHLDDIDPSFTGGHKSHKAAQDEIEAMQEKLRKLQDLLFAERRRSLLICLQAMDAGGKDGTINHVLGAMNPLGCRVARFEPPSPVEAAHDFLWRAHCVAPAQGEVVIFNRSHYEDVLIVRVHNLVPKKVWSRRFPLINNFEKNLAEHETTILKFYLHISPEEQLSRFRKRLDDPAKQWKINEDDYKERAFWKDYIAAYEDAMSQCSTPDAPWFVVPANHKWFRNLAVARIVVEHLESFRMTYPKPSVDIEHIRREYHAAQKKSR
jgi:PPK2 family polyphosphate:nucleotide phosphotransferase